MDSEEYERLKHLYDERVSECEAEEPGYREKWERLTAAVLKHGGELVCPPLVPDVHIDGITASLRPWSTENIRRIAGAPNNCHGNTAEMWLNGKAELIVVGYALHHDLWRQHTWGVDSEGRILETTCLMEKYAGAALDDIEALLFAGSNAEPLAFESAILRGGRITTIAQEALQTLNDSQ